MSKPWSGSRPPSSRLFQWKVHNVYIGAWRTMGVKVVTLQQRQNPSFTEVSKLGIFNKQWTSNVFIGLALCKLLLLSHWVRDGSDCSLTQSAPLSSNKCRASTCIFCVIRHNPWGKKGNINTLSASTDKVFQLGGRRIPLVLGIGFSKVPKLFRCSSSEIFLFVSSK